MTRYCGFWCRARFKRRKNSVATFSFQSVHRYQSDMAPSPIVASDRHCACDSLAIIRRQSRKTAATKKGFQNLWKPLEAFWLRGQDLNLRPLGYEPNELPDCSTPRHRKN